jgi:hypothetical protein
MTPMKEDFAVRILKFLNSRVRPLRLAMAGSGILLLIATVLSLVSAQQPTSEFRPIRVLGAQRVITEFPVQPVRDVGESLSPSELVLGVTAGEQSRAYPINMLTGPSREILNDTLGGQPWQPLGDTSATMASCMPDVSMKKCCLSVFPGCCGIAVWSCTTGKRGACGAISLARQCRDR